MTAARPYYLRHSFASLMIQAGYSPVELAAELGHAPTLTLNTYAHVFSEFARICSMSRSGSTRSPRERREAKLCVSRQVSLTSAIRSTVRYPAMIT